MTDRQLELFPTPAPELPDDFPVYLSGVSNDYVREAARGEMYGRLGLLIQPATFKQLHSHIPDFAAWGMDNGCFSSRGEFDGEQFLRDIRLAIETIDGAHETIRFAVAPDVFDARAMRGDARATLERSRPWFDRIRDAGAPVALVAQDGLQNIPGEVPWDDFDVLFLGGSDDFKLGYPNNAGSGAWTRNPTWDRLNPRPDALAFMRLLYAALEHGKPIHVGRVSSKIRVAYSTEIGADSCDGTYLKFGGQKNLERVRGWYRDLYAADLAV